MSRAAGETGWSYRPAVTRVTTLLTLTAAVYLLYWGWMHRPANYFNPEDGAGYALGIVGASLMLLLALYPLRKHARWMRNWGAIRHWFRMHMLFGIAGPVAILYHCNFSTGAANSNIALYSMLVVASSGLVGRYFYSRIHEGLYGRHVELKDVRERWIAARDRVQADARHVTDSEARIGEFERPLQAMRRTLAGSLWRLAAAGWRRRAILRRARRDLRAAPDVPAAERGQALALLDERLGAAAAVYRYDAFERLFSLWHLLHLPLFLMLIVTGVVHVVAVHVY